MVDFNIRIVALGDIHAVHRVNELVLGQADEAALVDALQDNDGVRYRLELNEEYFS